MGSDGDSIARHNLRYHDSLPAARGPDPASDLQGCKTAPDPHPHDNLDRPPRRTRPPSGRKRRSGPYGRSGRSPFRVCRLYLSRRIPQDPRRLQLRLPPWKHDGRSGGDRNRKEHDDTSHAGPPSSGQGPDLILQRGRRSQGISAHPLQHRLRPSGQHPGQRLRPRQPSDGQGRRDRRRDARRPPYSSRRIRLRPA